MLAQIALLRAYLSAVEENEIVLGAFYGAWFLGVFAGAWAGGARRRRAVRRSSAGWALAALAVHAALLPLLYVSLRTVRAGFGLPALGATPLSALLWIALAHFGLFGFVTGFGFPAFCQWASHASARPERAIATVYGIEAMGSVAAGAVFTFVLAGRIDSLAIALGMAALAAACATAAAMAEKPRRWLAAALGTSVAIGSAAALAPPRLAALERWIGERWWKAYGEGQRLVAERETALQRLALSESHGQFNALASGRFAFSFPDPYNTEPLANLILAQAAAAWSGNERTNRSANRRIALVGAAGIELASPFLRAGAERIDLLDPDPDLPQFLLDYLPEADRQALGDPRVHLARADPRSFLARGGEPYGLVVLLLPEPATASLCRFYSLEFFRMLRSRLARDGVLAMRFSSSVNYFGDEMGGLAGPILAALRQAFGEVAATPGVQAMAFAAANPGVVSTDPNELERRWAALQLPADRFSPLYFQTVFEAGQTAFVQAELARLGRESPPNRDARPASYLAALRLWARVSESGLGRALACAGSLRLWHCFAVAALWSLAWIAYGRATGAGLALDRARAAALTASTGVAGIGFSLLILLAYQSSLGGMARELGGLSAMFMAGLAAGGLALRAVPGRPLRGAAVCEGLLALLALGMAAAVPALLNQGLALHPLWRRSFFYGAMAAAGVLSGAQFALASHLWRSERPDVQRAAGGLEAADHLGAALGAIVFAIPLLPALGFAGAFLAIFALKAAGLPICAWPRR